MVKHYIWVCLCRCFWKRSAFELVGWVQKMSSLMQWVSASPSRAQTEQKGGGRLTAFSAWAGMSIASCPWTSVLLVFGPLDSGWNFYHQFPWFSGLRTQLSLQTMGFFNSHHHVHPLCPHLGLLKHFSVFYFNTSIVFLIIFLYFLSGCFRHLSIHI